MDADGSRLARVGAQRQRPFFSLPAVLPAGLPLAQASRWQRSFAACPRTSVPVEHRLQVQQAANQISLVVNSYNGRNRHPTSILPLPRLHTFPHCALALVADIFRDLKVFQDGADQPAA